MARRVEPPKARMASVPRKPSPTKGATKVTKPGKKSHAKTSLEPQSKEEETEGPVIEIFSGRHQAPAKYEEFQKKRLNCFREVMPSSFPYVNYPIPETLPMTRAVSLQVARELRTPGHTTDGTRQEDIEAWISPHLRIERQEQHNEKRKELREVRSWFSQLFCKTRYPVPKARPVVPQSRDQKGPRSASDPKSNAESSIEGDDSSKESSTVEFHLRGGGPPANRAESPIIIHEDEDEASTEIDTDEDVADTRKVAQTIDANLDDSDREAETDREDGSDETESVIEFAQANSSLRASPLKARSSPNTDRVLRSKRSNTADSNQENQPPSPPDGVPGSSPPQLGPSVRQARDAARERLEEMFRRQAEIQIRLQLNDPETMECWGVYFALYETYSVEEMRQLWGMFRYWALAHPDRSAAPMGPPPIPRSALGFANAQAPNWRALDYQTIRRPGPPVFGPDHPSQGTEERLNEAVAIAGDSEDRENLQTAIILHQNRPAPLSLAPPAGQRPLNPTRAQQKRFDSSSPVSQCGLSRKSLKTSELDPEHLQVYVRPWSYIRADAQDHGERVFVEDGRLDHPGLRLNPAFDEEVLEFCSENRQSEPIKPIVTVFAPRGWTISLNGNPVQYFPACPKDGEDSSSSDDDNNDVPPLSTSSEEGRSNKENDDVAPLSSSSEEERSNKENDDPKPPSDSDDEDQPQVPDFQIHVDSDSGSTEQNKDGSNRSSSKPASGGPVVRRPLGEILPTEDPAPSTSTSDPSSQHTPSPTRQRVLSLQPSSQPHSSRSASLSPVWYGAWETSKVVDLKKELKKRGISQMGLKTKQQIMDRLKRDDRENGRRQQTPAMEEEAEASEVEEIPAARFYNLRNRRQAKRVTFDLAQVNAPTAPAKRKQLASDCSVQPGKRRKTGKRSGDRPYQPQPEAVSDEEYDLPPMPRPAKSRNINDPTYRPVRGSSTSESPQSPSFKWQGKSARARKGQKKYAKGSKSVSPYGRRFFSPRPHTDSLLAETDQLNPGNTHRRRNQSESPYSNALADVRARRGRATPELEAASPSPDDIRGRAPQTQHSRRRQQRRGVTRRQWFFPGDDPRRADDPEANVARGSVFQSIESPGPAPEDYNDNDWQRSSASSTGTRTASTNLSLSPTVLRRQAKLKATRERIEQRRQQRGREESERRRSQRQSQLSSLPDYEGTPTPAPPSRRRVAQQQVGSPDYRP